MAAIPGTEPSTDDTALPLKTYRVTFTEGYLDVQATDSDHAKRVCMDELQCGVKVKSVKEIK